jgi:protein BUR2
MKEMVIAFCRLAQKNPHLVVDEQSKDYWKWRDAVLHAEEILIEAICFDLHLVSPSRLLSGLFDTYGIEDQTVTVASHVFLRDSSLTTLCLLSTPKTIAAAALYVGSRHCNYVIGDRDDKPWWVAIGVDTTDLEKACDHVIRIQELSAGQAKDYMKNTRFSSPEKAGI